MGCKVAQIERHYTHVMTKTRRKQITKSTPRKRKRIESWVDANATDFFTLEALRRYQRGELSEEFVLEILKFKPNSVSENRD